MVTKVVSIMFVTLLLSLVGTSQNAKSRHEQLEMKAPDVATEALKDAKAAAARKKMLSEKLDNIYGEGEYEIQELKMHTEQGEVASGVELIKTSEEIVIDTTPCGKKKTLVTFHKEYTREEVGDTTCNGKTYPRVQVQQK